MKKRFVVDTNVLINDPDCIYRLGNDNDVIIPIGVIEELDKHKKGNSEKARACRKAVRNIEEYRKASGGSKLRDGVDLPSGGKLFIRIDSAEGTLSTWLDEDYTDNKTLQICIEEIDRMKEADDKSQLILLTKDTALRIKADAYGVNVEDYQHSVIEDISMYECIPEIIIDAETLADIYSEDPFDEPDLFLDPEYPEDKVILEQTEFYVNQYLHLKVEEDDAPTSCRVTKVEEWNHGVKAIWLKLVTSRERPYGLSPKNDEQACVIDALLDPSISLVAIAGRSGTGKTLLSLAGGLQQTVNDGAYNKVLVMRPMVSVGKEMGFLPGSVEEKLQPWMAPINDSLEVLSNKSLKEALKDLDQFGWLEVQAISLIRGRSIPNSFIIIDEIQNLNLLEIKTIVTRAGKGTKIVVTGDPYQIDNPYVDEYSNGLTHLINNMKGEKIFAHVTLTKGERSELAEISSRKL